MPLLLRRATLPSVEVAAGMPRRSPFEITLSTEERLKLEAIARKYTSPYRDVIRAKIILMAAQVWPTTSSGRAWIRRARS
jgi:hypothetical protein